MRHSLCQCMLYNRECVVLKCVSLIISKRQKSGVKYGLRLSAIYVINFLKIRRQMTTVNELSRPFKLPSNTDWISFAQNATFYCRTNLEFWQNNLDFSLCPRRTKCGVILESIVSFEIFHIIFGSEIHKKRTINSIMQMSISKLHSHRFR